MSESERSPTREENLDPASRLRPTRETSGSPLRHQSFDGQARASPPGESTARGSPAGENGSDAESDGSPRKKSDGSRPGRQQSTGSDLESDGNMDTRASEGEDDKKKAISSKQGMDSDYVSLRTAMVHDRKEGAEGQQVEVALSDADFTKYLNEDVFNSNNIPDDNEDFVAKMQQRFKNAGVEIPTVEVRYENLTVRGKVYVGGRALPTLVNTILNFMDKILGTMKVSPERKTELTILDGVTGIIKPGRMTLLLAPPSGGKSTFLSTLAGHNDPTLDVQGKISYNGYEIHEFEAKRTAAYVNQQDVHMPEFTVRETMDYSARFQGVGNQFDLVYELLRKEKELGIPADPDTDLFMKASAMNDVSHTLATEYYMKIMGLDVCADTIVGDHLRKGISGGQKKRLTTAEMIVGPARVLFMDSISTGLDSSTTFQIVKCIKQFTCLAKETVVLTLLQPAPETYALFDDVILLAGGQVVYHGPCEHVEEFFKSCGFQRPRRKAVADYIQEVTSLRDQKQYWADKRQPYKFVSSREFVEAFKNFHVGQQMHKELETPFDQSESHKAALVFKRWTLPQWELFKINFQKEVLLYKKNFIIEILLLIQLAFASIIAAAVFFRKDTHHNNVEDAQRLSGMLFLTTSVVTFTAFGEITFTAIKFPCFIKFRELPFYPAWTWSLSMAIIKLPAGVIEALTYLALSYYVVDFAPSPFRFLRLLLLLVITVQMATALFRMLASFCQDIVLASSIGGFALTIILILGGYVIPRKEIRKWWIWAYWSMPFSYVQNGSMANEYLSHQWRKPIPNDSHTVGHRFILSIDSFDRGYWYWLTAGALAALCVVYNILFTFAITYLAPPVRTRPVVSQKLIDDWHAQRTGGAAPQALTKSQSWSSDSTLGSRKEEGSDPHSDHDNRVEEERLRRLSSLSKSRRERMSDLSDTGENGILERGMVLPFQPYSISFKDVSYSVDMPKEQRLRGATEDKLQLLRGVTGAFRPGVLTALMGVTGAGKSTLMDVLSGRKTRGYVEGDICINGFPKVQETFSRISGYCEQNDIHSPQITVHESIIFSAWLRLQPEIESQLKEDFAMEVLDLVELIPLKDALVGVPGKTGLSTEQRKRLTIAVELVANPSIIFMDEPTTGLDARSAATVMRAVRNTVDTGRTVVCTIHQPSIDIFESFDELLLLKQGGQSIYVGPLGKNAHRLIEYFERNADVPKIRDSQNPADWMLEITNPGMEKKLNIDFAKLYGSSSTFQETQNLVDKLSIPPIDTEDISFPTRFSQPLWNQFTMCLWKQHWTYWRSPGYNLMRFGLATSLAIFAGTLYWGIGKKLNSMRHINSLNGVVYIANGFYGILTANAIQPLIQSERVVFYRERGAGTYSEIAYAFAQCFIEVPYVFLASTLFHTINYSMMRFPWEAGKFFWIFYFTFASQISFNFLGMVTVALCPNAEAGTILTSFVVQVWSIFSGFAIPFPKIPSWLKWVYWCNPLGYTVYGEVSALAGKIDDVYLTTALGKVQTVKEFLADSYFFKYKFLRLVGPLAALFPIVCAVGYIFSIKYLNYQQR